MTFRALALRQLVWNQVLVFHFPPMRHHNFLRNSADISFLRLCHKLADCWLIDLIQWLYHGWAGGKVLTTCMSNRRLNEELRIYANEKANWSTGWLMRESPVWINYQRLLFFPLSGFDSCSASHNAYHWLHWSRIWRPRSLWKQRLQCLRTCRVRVVVNTSY